MSDRRQIGIHTKHSQPGHVITPFAARQEKRYFIPVGPFYYLFYFILLNFSDLPRIQTAQSSCHL
jgi:hypothetical protein